MNGRYQVWWSREGEGGVIECLDSEYLFQERGGRGALIHPCPIIAINRYRTGGGGGLTSTTVSKPVQCVQGGITLNDVILLQLLSVCNASETPVVYIHSTIEKGLC